MLLSSWEHFPPSWPALSGCWSLPGITAWCSHYQMRWRLTVSGSDIIFWSHHPELNIFIWQQQLGIGIFGQGISPIPSHTHSMYLQFLFFLILFLFHVASSTVVVIGCPQIEFVNIPLHGLIIIPENEGRNHQHQHITNRLDMILTYWITVPSVVIS